MKRYILATILAGFLSAPISAKEKPFYDSKSNIVCITGNYNLLAYGNKYRKVEVEIPASCSAYSGKQLCKILNDQKIGKQILDYLFCYDGTSLSEERLKDLALQNVLKSDDERAAIGVISKEDILKEDYLPILENNYIFLVSTVRGKKIWNAYKVEIDKDVLEQVFNCWDDMSKYNQISVPVSFVASDKAKMTYDVDAQEYVLKNKTKRKMSVKVPAFAIRGQVTGRNPFATNIGYVNGLNSCDKVAIYRTKEKNGKMYSSKVSTTRACNVNDSTANLYTFAGGQASYKKGDVAVYQASSNTSLSITGGYMEHSYDVSLTFDMRLGLSKTGISQYLMAKAGMGAYENSKRLYATNTGDVVKSPLIMNVGLGYGVGFEFAHCVEFMPYVMAQWEGNYFANKYESPNATYNDGMKDYHSSDYGKSVLSNAVRIPIGAKFNVNIFYPVQLVAGAEYAVNINLDNIGDKDDSTLHGDADRFFFKPTGYKRDGLSVFAGLRFNF